jgi:hypothetical protein
LSSRNSQASVLSKKTGFGKKGYIHLQKNKVYIHVDYDDKTYFLYAKTMSDILKGIKEGAYIRGYR